MSFHNPYEIESIRFTDQIIDPTIDSGFKLIFGRENVSEILLIDLFNSIFVGDPVLGNITSVTYVNTEHPSESIDGRGLRYDIKCVTSTGHQFIVEMQKADQANFIPRCQFYVSRAIAEQGHRGKDKDNKTWDFSLTPVVGVFVCNFRIPHFEPKPVVYARLMDVASHQPIGDEMRYIFIQLPCFVKGELECKDFIEQWMYNIKNMGAMQKVAFTQERDVFKYLDRVSNVAALSPAERDVYEAALKRARDYNAQMSTATSRAEEKGIAKGRLEEKKEIAGKMLEIGIDTDLISVTTGLSEAEILALK